MRRDALRQVLADDRLQNRLLFATLSARDDSGDNVSSVRHRDIEQGYPGATAAVSEQGGGADDFMDITTAPETLPDDMHAQETLRLRTDERLRMLSSLDSSFAHHRRAVPSSFKVKFARAPTGVDDEPGEVEFCRENDDFIALQEFLEGNLELLDRLDKVEDVDATRRTEKLHLQMMQERLRLEGIRASCWEMEQARAGLFTTLRDNSSEPLLVLARSPSLAKTLRPHFLLAALLLVVVLHTLSSVSRDQSSFVLSTIEVILYGAFAFSSGTNEMVQATLSPEQKAILDGFPRDVRAVISSLDLEPEYTLYACCPACFTLYRSDPSCKAKRQYPAKCSARRTPDEDPCGAQLLKRSPGILGTAGDSWVPIKTFAHQSLPSWINQLFSRPGLEDMAGGAWTNASSSTACADIWNAPAIQQFLGPDNHTPFSVQPHGSINLVFSLFVDWLNPHGNKKAGKSHSIGAIYMACLNLPPHLRFRTENIYLAGIIPGPTEPSLEEVNPFLDLVVDDLLVLWNRGIYLQQTASRAAGRLVKAVMIPLVCDMPALRKVGGFAGHSVHNFCNFCRLQKDEMNNVDRETWRRRTWAEHLSTALQWRDAKTKDERKKLFDEHGLRWSPLLRLPYWDPTRYALVDAMHNLYLGELSHHCREVWGIDIKEKSEKAPTTLPHSPEEQTINLEKAISYIKRGAEKRLMDLRKGYLVAIAELNCVQLSGSSFVKREYAKALVSWFENGEREIRVPPVLDESVVNFKLISAVEADISKFRILSADVLSQVRADIEKTHFPSWLQRPPRNFGSPSHGKLKADQWRTACTISLVITLVRLWGDKSASARNQELLHNFIDLVIAVDHGTRRTMSPDIIRNYDFFMKRYLRGLRKIFEHNLRPNHHAALHLTECLELFGPVQAWWAFPFERYNGLIGQIKHNSKASEMPLTFLRYFCIGSSLRWLMSTLPWPALAPYQRMMAAYNHAFGDAVREVHGAAADPVTPIFSYDVTKETKLERSIYDSLLALINRSSTVPFTSFFQLGMKMSPTLPRVLSHHVQYVNSVTVNRSVYADCDKGLRNSFVLFRADPTAHWPLAGQIKKVFYHVRKEPVSQTGWFSRFASTPGDSTIVEPFALVQQYQVLQPDHANNDPFLAFPDLGTWLCYDKPGPLHVVKISDIVSHFAAYKYTPNSINEECVVVRSLYRG